jgi:hypothetical protein
MWGALSYERTGLSFTIAAGPRQSSNSWVRVPWDSRPYFTISDSLRLAGLRWRYSTPPPHGVWISSYLNGNLYSLAYPRKMFVAFACPRKCSLLARSNDLVSKSLQFPFAYPWRSLFNTQRWFVCKNRISAEKCLPIRFLETGYMSEYIVTWTVKALRLYSASTDRRENSLPIVGTECLLNTCPATASYVVARTVESSPWQRCREVFTATLCSNQRGAARPGPARPGSARHGEDTALTIHVTLLLKLILNM